MSKDFEDNLFDGLEEKRKRICNAAIYVFKDKNFNKATVSEIASRAQVGKGTFYLYFQSKLKLLDFLLEHGTEKLIKYVRNQINKGDDPENKLRKGIEAQLYFFNAHRDFFDFFIREMWTHREGLKEQINKLKEKYIVIFANIINEGIENNQFRPVSSETISSGLFGMMSISSFHWLLFTKEFPVEDVEESIKEVFFNGLLK